MLSSLLNNKQALTSALFLFWLKANLFTTTLRWADKLADGFEDRMNLLIVGDDVTLQLT